MVLTSGLAIPKELEEAGEKPGFLQKPYSPAGLTHDIRAMLD